MRTRCVPGGDPNDRSPVEMGTSVQCVLFDLDGTLSKSEAGIIGSLRQAFDDLGLPRLDDRTERGLIGPTDGAKAPPGTIRGDHSISVQNNLIHGSDSPENAALEIALWFKDEELVKYTPVDQPWVVGS